MTKAKISAPTLTEPRSAAAFPFFVSFNQALKLRSTGRDLAIGQLSKNGDK